ncbi:collagen-binding domain-containing protein [Agromyces aerolatus]|uniref:collagen-binding domain-containing protein n=1 Tax=Agromyces sp. LY-1074 TaxID=3074080 RepID=UPI002858F9A9|nr:MULTISPECIES: collagen-binding domain-containing protein [unclassified Agromyces]MDR5701672.1 choice-of-anchor A family protein [Agromyces sp. LY-1074]MDR5707888.1 choice-of-anchor A family protein [Agromyces sp. LY-1358]
MGANRGDIIRKGTATGVAMLAFTGAGALLSVQALAAPGDPIGPINPVAQDLNGHPANSGFLVFVEGDVQLNADEAEGTIALGGDLAFNSAYNIAAGAVPPATITVAPDTSPVYLYVGGGVTWPDDDGLILRVLNNGFAKIADTTTYGAATVDQNGATGAWHVFEPDASYESQPRIEGTIPQTPESIATPVPTELLDISGAFGLYRDTTAQLALCTPTIDLTDQAAEPIAPPYPEGSSGALRLVPGQTNVFEIAADDLARLGEISFPEGGPSPDTPLLVNVTGETFVGTTPNLAGLSSANAPYVLWNFPEATTVTVTGGDSIEGTLYAPNALLNWQITQNIEGNVIAAEFIHGMPASGPVGAPRGARIPVRRGAVVHRTPRPRADHHDRGADDDPADHLGTADDHDERADHRAAHDHRPRADHGRAHLHHAGPGRGRRLGPPAVDGVGPDRRRLGRTARPRRSIRPRARLPQAAPSRIGRVGAEPGSLRGPSGPIGLVGAARPLRPTERPGSRRGCRRPSRRPSCGSR